jgi:Rrf2 family protein
MIINNSVRYGLMAVGYTAAHSQDGLIMAEKIAKEYRIPKEFLLKIMQNLAKAGVLKSKRGRNGGFVLGREPDQITLFDIFEVIDKSPNRVQFLDKPTKEKLAARTEKTCEKAIFEWNAVLADVSIADLIGEKKK